MLTDKWCQRHVPSDNFFCLNIYILGVSPSVHQVSSLSVRSVLLSLDHLYLVTTLSCLVLFLFLFIMGSRMPGMSSSLTR